MNISHITHYIERNPPVRAYVEELIDSYEISKILNSKLLTQNDLWFLKNQSELKNCLEPSGRDLVETIIKMSQGIREYSHGGSTLSLAFIPDNLYKEIEENVGMDPKATCKIVSVEIFPSIYMPDNFVIGLCRSKFPYPTVDNVLITGRIKDASK